MPWNGNFFLTHLTGLKAVPLNNENKFSSIPVGHSWNERIPQQHGTSLICPQLPGT